MEKSDFISLEKKIDTLIKLQAYQIVAGKNVTEGAPILRRLGLTPIEIASIYDTTSNAVNARLSESKKGAEKTKKATPSRQKKDKSKEN